MFLRSLFLHFSSPSPTTNIFMVVVVVMVVEKERKRGGGKQQQSADENERSIYLPTYPPLHVYHLYR
jgi:hypothetical protein